MQAFDPRPVRATTLQALVFLAGPGSFEGAQLLWTRAGLAPLGWLLPASTHAIFQLVGGFLTLILGFLAYGVPHLLGFDADKVKRARVPTHLMGVLLVAEAAGELAANEAIIVSLRALLVVDLLVLFFLLWAAKPSRERSYRRAPLPVLLVALACAPAALVFWLWEAAGGPVGVASDLLLYATVVPVILGMSFQMFASLLQLEFPREGAFFAALGAWFLGAVLRAAARVEPALVGLHAPLLVLGAGTWLFAMRGLRPRPGGLPLVGRPGLEMRASVVVGAASLFVGGALGAWPRMHGHPLSDDLARHTIALGFVLVVTMAVTLRVLPRFARGRPSSPAWALATLAVIVVALALRALSLVGGLGAAALWSALLSWLGVMSWGAHLWRGLRAPAPPAGASAPEGAAPP